MHELPHGHADDGVEVSVQIPLPVYEVAHSRVRIPTLVIEEVAGAVDTQREIRMEMEEP